MQPAGAAAASTGLDNASTMPSWLRARIARYEAKAFSDDPGGVLTNNDVVTTANAQGMQKTCVQEVGSNTVSGAATGTGKYGPNQAPRWWCCGAISSTSASNTFCPAVPAARRDNMPPIALGQARADKHTQAGPHHATLWVLLLALVLGGCATPGTRARTRSFKAWPPSPTGPWCALPAPSPAFPIR